MPRRVGELHKGKTSSICRLCRQHKPELFCRHLRRQMNNPLNILYRVPVTVTVAQSAVNKRGGPGPDKCHKAVISIPGVHHSVKFRAGRVYFQAVQFFIPVCFQLQKLFLNRFLRVFVPLQGGISFFWAAGSKEKNNSFCFLRHQRDPAGQRAAGILIVTGWVPQAPWYHALRIAISMIFSQEMFFFAAPGGHCRPFQSKKAFGYIFLVHLFIFRKGIQIPMNLLDNLPFLKQCSGNKQWVLQIHLILLIIAVIGKFGIAG